MNRPCLITALAAESRPLIARYRLKPQRLAGLRLYQGDNCLLLETGLGKLSAAACTAAALQAVGTVSALVNIGICGAGRGIGEVLLAHSVTDQGSGKCWYPHLPPQRVLPAVGTAALLTLDKPSDDYNADTLFDMEAAGIMAAGHRQLDSAAMQFIKVVSDNAENHYHTLNKTLMGELIENSLPAVDALCDFYRSNNQHIDEDAELQSSITHDLDLLGKQLHITVSERHALARLMQRYCVLSGKLPDIKQLADQHSAARARRWLDDQINQIPIRYPQP